MLHPVLFALLLCLALAAPAFGVAPLWTHDGPILAGRSRSRPTGRVVPSPPALHTSSTGTGASSARPYGRTTSRSRPMPTRSSRGRMTGSTRPARTGPSSGRRRTRPPPSPSPGTVAPSPCSTPRVPRPGRTSRRLRGRRPEGWRRPGRDLEVGLGRGSSLPEGSAGLLAWRGPGQGRRPPRHAHDRRERDRGPGRGRRRGLGQVLQPDRGAGRQRPDRRRRPVARGALRGRPLRGRRLRREPLLVRAE